MALASLALGVVALLLSLVPLIGVVALVAGTAALALGVAVVRRPGVGLLAQCLAVAGAVLGGLGLLMSLIVLLVLAPVMTTAPSLEEHLVVVEGQVAEG